METTTRLPAIQGLRALAVSLVVFFHFDLAFPNGYLGVDVFFVISGFVIARLIQGQLEKKEFSFRRFYYSRFLRLFPALAVTVVVTLTISSIFANISAFESTWKTGVSALFGVSNLTAQIVSRDYFASSSLANSLLHTWSLGVEEQFYLFLPVFLVLVSSRFRNLLSAGARLGLLAASASFAVFMFSDSFASNTILAAVTGYYSPVSRAWEFLAGVLVSFAARSGMRISRVASQAFLGSGLALILVSSIADFDYLETPRWLPYLLTVLGTSLAVFSQKDPGSQNRFLALGIMVWLGNRSYSIYLWHWPLVSIALLTFGKDDSLRSWWLLALLVPISDVSYRLFEQWHKRKVEGIPPAVKSASMMASVLTVSLVSYWVPGWLYPGGDEQNRQRSALPEIYDSGCHGELVVCLNGVIVTGYSDSRQNVYLVGDSNAAHHYPGLALATAELNLNLYSMTAPGCSGLDFEQLGIVENRRARRDCEPFIQSIRSLIAEAPPGLVVLGFSLRQIEFWNQNDSATRADLAAVLEEFQALVLASGHELAIVEPIPYWSDRFPEFEPDLLPRRLSDQILISFPNYSWKDILGPIDTWTELEMDERTKVFETHSSLCSESGCDIFRDGIFRYRDATHITIEASKKMKTEWVEFLANG